MTGTVFIEGPLIITFLHKLLRCGYGPGRFRHGQILRFTDRRRLNRRLCGLRLGLGHALDLRRRLGLGHRLGRELGLRRRLGDRHGRFMLAL